MTVDGWLAARQPQAPAELVERVRSALGDGLGRDAREAGALCLAAAERELRAFLPGCEAGTDRAIDLLTVDALTTYALEALVEGDADFAERARDALARFAALAERAG